MHFLKYNTEKCSVTFLNMSKFSANVLFFKGEINMLKRKAFRMKRKVSSAWSL